jgi:hypothetical protein
MGMGLLLLVLSAALLPSWRILIFLLLVVAAVTALLWRSLIRIYSKAQLALEETLSQPPVLRHPECSLRRRRFEKPHGFTTNLLLSSNSRARGELHSNQGLFASNPTS